MASLLQYAGAALVVVVVLLAYNWTALTGWQVRCDLRDYSQAIRRAECGIAEKERLLDQVETIEDDLRRGRCIGWLRWCETDQVIRDLLQGGVNSQKARLMVREFRRLEAGAPGGTVQLTGM